MARHVSVGDRAVPGNCKSSCTKKSGTKRFICPPYWNNFILEVEIIQTCTGLLFQPDCLRDVINVLLASCLGCKAWFPYDVQWCATRSVAVCVSLIADYRKHCRQMFPFKSEAIADKPTTTGNPLRSEEKKPTIADHMETRLNQQKRLCNLQYRPQTQLVREMLGGAIAEIPKPKRIHVILSKVIGGTMVFWVLWRLKHDWHELVGHKYVFEKEDEEKAKGKQSSHH